VPHNCQLGYKIYNTNKLSRVMSCLQYLSHVPLMAYFSWIDIPRGPSPPHLWGFKITLSYVSIKQGYSIRWLPASSLAAFKLAGD